MSGTLQHDGSAAGVVAALSLVGLREVAVHERPGEAVLTLDGVETKGAEEILRVLARRFPERGLLGSGLGAAAVEEAAARVFSADQLEAHVALRTFVAGHAVTLADLLHLSVPAGGPHSRRWRRQVEYVCGLQAARKEAVVSGAVNFGSQGSFDKMRLDDAVLGKVVVRFPPEPSGYLHIGHGKAVLLNDYYRTLYKGQMIVRFDDTNPAKEKTEFADAILEDLARLGIKPDRVTHTSDNFAYILGKAKQLIAQGDAYVDDQEKETIRTQRFNKEDGPARNLPVATHLERWEAMLAGAEYGRKCVLRARISMQHDNSALRDPALARCVDTPHQITGTQFKCYPTYDLAIAVCDDLEGVTHAMRDSQYQERIPLYKWVLEKLGLRSITIRQFARVNFTHTILSKRKLQFFVDQGFVTGWDDPALPTVRGILARGLSPQALREFILSLGASVSRTNMSMSKLWAANKKLLDPVAPRYVAISSDCFAVEIVGAPEETRARNLHPKNAAVGSKQVTFSAKCLVESADAHLLAVGEEFTFLDWGNAVVEALDKDKKFMRVKLHLAGDVKTTKRKVSWVVASAGSPVVRLTTIGELITTESLPQQKEGQPEVDWTTVINPKLKNTVICCGETAMAQLRPGDRLQIVRRGYFCVLEHDASGLHLVDIPDGKEGGASILVDK